jgi:hypothetical protein
MAQERGTSRLDYRPEADGMMSISLILIRHAFRHMSWRTVVEGAYGSVYLLHDRTRGT